MKKFLSIVGGIIGFIMSICIFFMFIGWLVFFNPVAMNPKYGKDTVKAFGDSEFRILIYHVSKNEKQWNLYDENLEESIDLSVKKYEEKEPYAYFIGSEGYTKINYNTRKISQSKNIEEFDKKDRYIFEELSTNPNVGISIEGRYKKRK